MKPDGVDTAAAEPVAALDANAGIEVAPLGDQAPDQVPPDSQTETTGQGEPQPQPAETPAAPAAAKSGKDKAADPKAKTKGPVKTKTPTKTTTTAGPRPATAQNRLTNGVQKAQTNGVAKKTSGSAAEKKTTASATVAPKKPGTGNVTSKTSSSTSKVAEKKPVGAPKPATAPVNGTKTGSTTLAAKKTAVAPANGEKAKPKTTAPRPASAAATKPSSSSSPKPDKTPVSKTPSSRPATGTATSRPGSSAALKSTVTASKASASGAKPSPSAAKTASTAARPSPAKSTAPSAGGTPTPPSKTTTPIKKDPSKPATSATKKPAASPLTRPASTKTPKPDTPKAATPAKPESASKKLSASSKAAADSKTSKPKDSKPTPSKEVSASPKTPSAKNSISKTTSPKKAVGSSTPMPVKRGPKAGQVDEPVLKEEEKKAEAPSVDIAASQDAMTAATAVTGAIAAVATAAGAVLTAAENETEDLPSEPKSEFTPEPKPELIAEPISEPAPKLSSELLETESEPAAEPDTEYVAQAESEIAAEPESQLAAEPESELATDKFDIPEVKSESVHEFEPDLLHELKSEPTPEPKSELLLETESELTTEYKSELLNEPEPEPEPVLTTETSSAFLLETESELTFEHTTTLPMDTESKFLSEPLHDYSPLPIEEDIIPASGHDTAEETDDTHSIPEGAMEETPKDVMPELASQLNLVSLEEPMSAASPLGTTVMSPPSSPTGDSPVPMEHQASAPLLDMDASLDPWSKSQPLFSSDFTAENLEDEVQTKCATEEPVEEEIPFSLKTESNLLSTSPLEQFSGASPTSPGTDKEEAIEKAEEEINEDDHEEEEEEGEEEEEEEEKEEEKEEEHVEQETVKVTPQEQKEAFNSGLSEFGQSSWGMTDSATIGSGIQEEKSETLSPFQTESHQSEEDEGNFSLKEAEVEQPFMGPPGVKSFSDEEEEEEEEEDDEPVKEKMDIGFEHTDDQQIDAVLDQEEHYHTDNHHHLHYEEEPEHMDKEANIVSEGLVQSEIKSSENVEEDEYEEGYTDNLNCTAPVPSMPMTAAWGPSNPFADTWAQPTSIHMTSSPLETETTNLEVPTKSPAEAWLDQPLGRSSKPLFDIHGEMESSVPTDGSNLCAPAVGMSQSSTLSGAALAAHSSSETSTPEELRDYDSSSGVESRSDKQQTPVPAAQPDLDQDLGIHLERGDGEEEEAETLPADEVLGDAPTAPASVPSSPTTSGDEASDTEGEMQINDPDAAADDAAAFDSTSASRNLPALEEDEEAADMQVGEEDGGTPQSANSVASYGFDCSVSNSNAHSTAESCGKSPGIFSLENEDQLTEEAKDPSLIKELTLPAAAAHPEDLLGCPVDLLPLGQQGDPHASLDDQYLLSGKSGAGTLEEVDPESPMHLSPQHEAGSDGQPPYYSTVCDKTDSFLAGRDKVPAPLPPPPPPSNREVRNDNLLCQNREVNDNHYLTLVQNTHRLYKLPQSQLQHDPQQQQQHQPQQFPGWASELVKLPVETTLQQAPQVVLPPVTNGQLRRLEQHQLQLRQIQQRQEQERQQRLWLEGEKQRQELRRQLERQQRLRHEQERQQRQWQEQERHRLERQRQLERQRRELLQLQLHQQQQEQRQRQQLLQWQLELEQQFRLKQQQQQQQQQGKPQSAALLSPSSGLCTIYEAMETSEDEDEGRSSVPDGKGLLRQGDTPLQVANGNLRRPPARELDWNTKVDLVQQLINQALLLEGEDGSPPLLYLPGPGGGTLTPLESSLWPHILHRLNPKSATITSVSSYSPTSHDSSSKGDWTVVELETHH